MSAWVIQILVWNVYMGLIVWFGLPSAITFFLPFWIIVVAFKMVTVAHAIIRSL